AEVSMQLSQWLTLLALSVALGSFVGCERRPDPSENVSKALRDANLAEVRVDWDNRANIAHLKGKVETPTDRQRAEEIATSAVGTSGTVLNEISVPEAADHAPADSDGLIKSTLQRMVDDDQVLRNRDIAFDVSDGIVVVKG